MEIVLTILDKLLHDSQNICRCLTLNAMHIKVTSWIICLINDNLTNTSSTPPPEVKKNNTVFAATKTYDMLIFNLKWSLISLYSKFWYQLLTVAYLKNYFKFLSSDQYISHRKWGKWEWYEQSPEKMKNNDKRQEIILTL